MKNARKKNSWPLAALALLALGALACVTINVYFPEEAVKDLSEKIEDAVAREAEAAPAPPAAPAQPSQNDNARLGGRPLGELAAIAAGNLLRLLPAGDAIAQDVADPGISNPAIRRIIESRATRVGELGRFKASGAIGENNQALLEARDLQSLPLADRAAAQRLIKAENDDREQMFKEIAAATGAELSTMPQIRTTYAETLRQKAKPGEWIQQASGEWRQK